MKKWYAVKALEDGYAVEASAELMSHPETRFVNNDEPTYYEMIRNLTQDGYVSVFTSSTGVFFLPKHIAG